MICPSCGADNLEGADMCESCQQDLTLVSGFQPKSEIERALMEDSISSVPPQQAICLSQDTSVSDAVSQMNEKHVGSVLVTDNTTLLGIVTERDILYKAFIHPEVDLATTPLSAIMTPDPEYLNADDTMAYALQHMSVGGYRHLPIMRKEQIKELISIQGILSCIVKHLQ